MAETSAAHAAANPASGTNTLRGVAFMVTATVIFAAQDGFSKALAANHSAIFVTMWRYWAFGAVCLFLLWRTGFRKGLTSGQPRLQVIRGVLLALEICVAIAAFALIGLAPSHAIFAFMPLLVVALSGPVLGEKVGWRRRSAVLDYRRRTPPPPRPNAADAGNPDAGRPPRTSSPDAPDRIRNSHG